jgi:glutathione S-transferase
MTVVLYHHPYSRAASVVWMLEKVGAPFELRDLDLTKVSTRRPSR